VSASPGAVLLPARPQTLWGPPAVANFALGGLGSGLYLVAALAGGLDRTPAVVTAAWLGPLLVLAGFGAVALEAGRPLRGARVLTRLSTSWMSRECVLGLGFTALAALEFLAPGPAVRLAAAAAAALFAVAQGFIPRRARAVSAWDVPLLPLLFLVSALASGVGLHALLGLVSGADAGAALPSAVAAAGLLAGLVWLAYLTWPGDEAFRAAIRPLREGAPAVATFATASILPLALGLLGTALSRRADLAAALAGVLLIAGQVQVKSALILVAGRLRPVTVTRLTLGRRSS
jgi:DMSO reductase anchor subunit